MSFGGWAISEDLYEWLVEHVPPGKTILELGSGDGTAELVKRWAVATVEHDKAWLGHATGAHYIYAPLIRGWYDAVKVKQGLPEYHCPTAGCSATSTLDISPPLCGTCGKHKTQYDCLLIDGPPQNLGRSNFLNHMDLFNPAVPWVFDDMHRPQDRRMAMQVAYARGQKLGVRTCADGKAFGVIRGQDR